MGAARRSADAVGQPGGERAPWGSLSRERIVAAALELVRREGAERLTIRRLAAALGVAPMSLYTHVRSRDDLLAELVERLLAKRWRPRVDRRRARAWLQVAAERLRKLLVEEPLALELYLRRPVTTPAARERMAAMVDVLQQAGLKPAAARRAYAALHTYTVGFAALQAARQRSAAGAGEADPLARQLASYTTPRQFLAGLRLLLDGIGLGEG